MQQLVPRARTFVSILSSTERPPYCSCCHPIHTRSINRLNTIVRRKLRARFGPVNRAEHELGHDRDHLVDVADELPGRIALPERNCNAKSASAFCTQRSRRGWKLPRTEWQSVWGWRAVMPVERTEFGVPVWPLRYRREREKSFRSDCSPERHGSILYCCGR